VGVYHQQYLHELRLLYHSVALARQREAGRPRFRRASPTKGRGDHDRNTAVPDGVQLKPRVYRVYIAHDLDVLLGWLINVPGNQSGCSFSQYLHCSEDLQTCKNVERLIPLTRIRKAVGSPYLFRLQNPTPRHSQLANQALGGCCTHVWSSRLPLMLLGHSARIEHIRRCEDPS
jgi:hypothetical protein